MICSRCLLILDEKDALGGSYGGVVCIKHRICSSCWWENDIISIEKGKRKNEPISTRNIPLVKDPRKFMKIKCFGCLYNTPSVLNSQEIFKGIGSKNDPIIINK